MRRALVLVALAVPLFLGIALLGLVLASWLGPERVRSAAEEGLSEALAAPVSIERARISLRGGLSLVAEGIRAWPAPGGPGLEVERAVARVDLLALLRGRLRPQRIELDGAQLRIERTAEGALEPDVFARLRGVEGAPAQAPRDPMASLVGRLRAGIRRVAEVALPSRTLQLRGARVVFLDRQVVGPEGAAIPLRFEEVHAELREASFGDHLTLRAGGTLVDDDGAAGSLELEGGRGEGSSLDLTLSVSELDLRALEAWADAWHPGLTLAGLVHCRARLQAGAGVSERVELAGAVQHLALALPRGARQPPLVIQEREAQAAATLELAPLALRIVRGEVRAHSLALSLEGAVARPLRGESRSELALAVEKLELGQVLELARWLPGAARHEAESVLRHFEAGQVTELELRMQDSLLRLRDRLTGSVPLLPGELELGASVREARIRVGDDDVLEGVFGHARWHGDTLELSGLRGALRDDPLPQLDFSLTGLRHLVAVGGAQRHAPPPVVPLPGRRALGELLEEGRKREPERPGWTRLVLDAEWILHPILLWPLEQVHAVATPTPEGVRVALERARWGGAPIRGEIDWRRAPLERFRIAVQALPPRAAGAARGAQDAAAAGRAAVRTGTARARAARGWARGRFELEHALGASFPLARLHGELRAGGALLALEALEAPVEPRGRLFGDVLLDLSQPQAVGCRAHLELEDVEAESLAAALRLPDGAVTGTLALSSALSGELRPGVRALASLGGELLLRAEDGEVRQRLPLLLAISSVSDALRLFPSRDEIRYDSIEAVLELAEGALISRSLSIRSPDLRLVASGRVDVVQEPHELEAVVGVFFLRPLDTVLGTVPVVSNILLGPDESLFGAYFEVRGPWSDPKARMVPMKTLASGPASFVLEGVPAFVRSGIRAIQSVLGPGAAAPGTEAADAPRPGS